MANRLPDSQPLTSAPKAVETPQPIFVAQWPLATSFIAELSELKDDDTGADGTTADGGGRLLTCTDGTSVALPAVTDAGSPGDFLKISFNVKTDGVNDNRFTSVANGYYWQRGTTGAGVRTSINRTTNPITVTPKGNGDYDALIAGFGSTVRTLDAGTTFLLTVNSGNGNEAASIVSHVGGPDRFVVTDQSCSNCHGDKVFRSPEGPEAAEHHGVRAHQRSNVLPTGRDRSRLAHRRTPTATPSSVSTRAR